MMEPSRTASERCGPEKPLIFAQFGSFFSGQDAAAQQSWQAGNRSNQLPGSPGFVLSIFIDFRKDFFRLGLMHCYVVLRGVEARPLGCGAFCASSNIFNG
jgi:hypothetical protein